MTMIFKYHKERRNDDKLGATHLSLKWDGWIHETLKSRPTQWLSKSGEAWRSSPGFAVSWKSKAQLHWSLAPWRGGSHLALLAYKIPPPQGTDGDAQFTRLLCIAAEKVGISDLLIHFSKLSIFKEFYKGRTKWGTSIWEEPRRQLLRHMTDFLGMLPRCTTRHLSERLRCDYFWTHHHHAVQTQELETSHSDMGQTPMIRHANLKDCLTLSPSIQAGLFSHSTQGPHTSGHQKETALKWDWLSTHGGPQVLGALRSHMATLLLYLAWVRFFWNWIS